MKAKAFLFGPFIGELSWEFFRFAPHAIYLKKKNPGLCIIVLTRESRFDLYGQYADILVPLRIKDDSSMERDCYKLLGYKEEYYNTLVKYFKIKFRKRYNIIKHYFPDIRLWRYKVKWQIHRNEMNYDFKPRKPNIVMANNAINGYIGIVDNLETNARTNKNNIIKSTTLIKKLHKIIEPQATLMGGLIESIKNVKFVIGTVNSDISQLALLLGIPLIHIGEPITLDYVSLINPGKTPVIIAKNINEGIRIYETM